MSESDIQFAIKKTLGDLGYVCLSTSSVASGRPKRGASTSRGIPDLLVSHSKWQEGVWLGLEVKTEKGLLKAEQQALLDQGRIYIVRSWEDAWNAVQAFERAA